MKLHKYSAAIQIPVLLLMILFFPIIWLYFFFKTLVKPIGGRYIEVFNTEYRADDVMQETEHGWLGAKMTPLYPNFKERFIHDKLGKHFTFGQPYCVVCLKREKKLPKK